MMSVSIPICTGQDSGDDSMKSYPNFYNQYLSIKDDLDRLKNILEKTKYVYHKELKDVECVPLMKKVFYLLIRIISLGNINPLDRRIDIMQKKEAIHQKYCPLLDKITGDIRSLMFDYKNYSDIDRRYFIKLQISLDSGGYPSNWVELSKTVRVRDEYRCRYCGSTDRILHVHHIIPLSKGGSNSFSNLITLCEKCHLRKHPHMRA